MPKEFSRRELKTGQSGWTTPEEAYEGNSISRKAADSGKRCPINDSRENTSIHIPLHTFSSLLPSSCVSLCLLFISTNSQGHSSGVAMVV